MAKTKSIAPILDETSNADKHYRTYVLWKARPISKKDAAVPQTIQAFMDAYGLIKDDIREYMARPEYTDDLLFETVLWAKSKTPQLIHAAYQQASKNGSFSDVERFVKLVESIDKNSAPGKDGNTTSTQFNFFGGLTDEQFRRIAAREISLSSPVSEK